MTLKLRVIALLCFKDGVLFRTRKFVPDYRYTVNFLEMGAFDELVCINLDDDPISEKFVSAVGRVAEQAMTPMAVGGGIREVDDALALRRLLPCEKFVICRAFKDAPQLIEQFADKFGSSSVVAGINVEDWDRDAAYVMAAQYEKLGAGEILLNSIERDGSVTDGLDLVATDRMYDALERIPFVVAGGCGNWVHAHEAFLCGADGVATSNIFHLTETSVKRGKKRLQSLGDEVRVV